MGSRSYLLAPLVAAGVCLAGCAGEGGPIPPPTTTLPGVDLAQIQTEIFEESCALSGCHSAGSRQGNLDLSSAATSHAELVDVVSECAGKILVVPGDPDASYLLHKVGDGPEPCGTLMPQLLPPLTAGQIQLIRDWIEDGAEPPAAASFAIDAAEEAGDESRTATSSSSTTSSTQE